MLKKINNSKIKLTSIAIDSNLNEIKEAIRTYKPTFDIFIGSKNVIKDYILRYMPTTLILDKHNKVRYSFYGIPNWTGEKLSLILKNLAKEN